jgi:hypothetical protein
MSAPRILILIVLLILLINLIGWLTKPDDYRPRYRGSLSPIQPYAQQINAPDLFSVRPRLDKRLS